jgi:hypothetical protein
MAYIPRELREFVFKRANYQCEYCQTQQVIVIEMAVDHITPESLGGLSTEDNLCLACITCNTAKRDFQTGFDLVTREDVALFNPRSQSWNDQFMWNDDQTRIIGQTPTGRATVARLKLNREPIVRARMKWVHAGWHPPK